MQQRRSSVRARGRPRFKIQMAGRSRTHHAPSPPHPHTYTHDIGEKRFLRRKTRIFLPALGCASAPVVGSLGVWKPDCAVSLLGRGTVRITTGLGLAPRWGAWGGRQTVPLQKSLGGAFFCPFSAIAIGKGSRDGCAVCSEQAVCGVRAACVSELRCAALLVLNHLSPSLPPSLNPTHGNGSPGQTLAVQALNRSSTVHPPSTLYPG